MRISILVVGCAWLLTASSANSQTLTPEEFLESYTQEVKPLENAYRGMQMTATLVENFPVSGDQSTLQVEIFQNEGLQKVVAAGDESSSTLVANPEISFSSKLPADSDKPKLEFLSPRRGLGYSDVAMQIEVNSPLHAIPYCYYSAPLAELFADGKLTVEKIEDEEEKDGRKLVRATVRKGRMSPQSPVEYSLGWMLFDPAAHWALQGFSFDQFTDDGSLIAKKAVNVEYGPPVNGIPALRRAESQTFDSKDVLVNEVTFDVTSLEFQPPSDEEFTLQGSGIAGVTAPSGAVQLPIMFYTSVAIAILALAGIIGLRYFRKRQSTPE